MTQTATPDLDANSFAGLGYVDRARLIAPLIERDAAEIERTRRITPAVVDALRAAELFWMMVPKSLGGGGLGIVECMLVNEEIARADASTGWAFMANAFGTGIIAGYLPEEGSRELFGGPVRAITAGMSAPVGKARKVDGGIVANGRWQFGSGSDYATWIGLGVQVVDDAGEPVMLDNGLPDMRFSMVPRDEVTFLGNWDVTGLVGTGSQDYTVKDVYVPDRHSLSSVSTTPVLTDGLFYMGLLGLSVAGHTAVAMGVMKRALQEVATITDGKIRGGYPSPVSDYPVFHFEFAKADADFRSARAYALELYAEAEDHASRNGGLTPELTGRVRQAATWAHHACDRVVGFARLWSGTQAFRNPSDLGRVVRDAGVLTQHLLIDNITLIDAGPALIDSWKKR